MFLLFLTACFPDVCRERALVVPDDSETEFLLCDSQATLQVKRNQGATVIACICPQETELPVINHL
jgi:hypothetical protein